MESVLADQRNRLNEYQRELITQSLKRLQSEKAMIVYELISCLDSVRYDPSLDNFSQTECVICMEEFKKGAIVSKIPTCGHIFHGSCCGTWFKSKN